MLSTRWAQIVESLARPGGKITGFTQFEYSTSGKWLELLKEIAPRVTRAAVLRDSALPSGLGQFAAIQSAAPGLGMEVKPINVRTPAEIERGLVAFAGARPMMPTGLREQTAGGQPTNFQLMSEKGQSLHFGRPAMSCPPQKPTCRVATRCARRRLTRSRKRCRYSITSSVMESSPDGRVSPSALAVLRLRTSWNLADCTTGRSVGFSPLRMRPV